MTVPAPGVDDRFAAMRPRLVGVAYRLVGTTADADDVVQDAWFRWQRADREAIDNPDAWLTTVVTRLALDRLRRRKREQERYVGPWLPSPLVEPLTDPDRQLDPAAAPSTDPAGAAELADSMTTAFLLLLEQLTPDERAAFLLADVFGEPYPVIAAAMDRSEAACRQLASRARRKLRDLEQPALSPGPEARRVAERFIVAVASGDEATALATVASDAVLLSDGGPNRRAARRPVLGPHRIVRFLTGLQRRTPPDWSYVPAVVGGVPGIVVHTPDGEPYLSMSFEVHGDRIRRVLLTVNPDKLDAIWREPHTIE